MRILGIGLALGLVLASSKELTYTINVLIPNSNLRLLQGPIQDLVKQLDLIAKGVENAFNTTTYSSTSHTKVAIVLNHVSSGQPLTLAAQMPCGGPLTDVVTLLDQINRIDDINHYIVLLPCLSSAYHSRFEALNIPTPVVEHATNVECTKRTAIFHEKTTSTLTSSFSNAILKIMLPGSSKDHLTLTQRTDGDSGVKDVINFRESTAIDVASNECYNTVKKTVADHGPQA